MTFQSMGQGITGVDSLFQNQVPVLAYVSVSDTSSSSQIVSRSAFQKHMQILYDSGYRTCQPEDLYNSMVGGSIPPKVILITFEDSYEEHFTTVFPILKSFGFKAIFFINTVVIGKPGFLTAGQIRELSDAGHTVGAHTWSHPNLIKPRESDLQWQVDKPRKELESIIGKPVTLFAYPSNLWSDRDIVKLKNRGIKMAFQSQDPPSKRYPLYSIQRFRITGISRIYMFCQMKRSFN